MTERTHQKCPRCDGEQFAYNTETGLFNCFSGSCGFNSKGVGLCFDGNTIVPFKNKYEEEEGMSLEPFFKEFRGIHKTIMEKYGAYFTEHDGKETVHYTYPEGSTKHKDQSVPKKHKDHIKISGKMDKFYGQDDYTGGSILTITEGEEDRLSVIQMMGNYPCVSVPNASPSKDFWNNARGFLEGFEKIVLSVDNDEAGDKLADKFYALFPSKVYRVKHGKYKDANDFLVASDYAGYKAAWWAATKMKPDGFVSSPEQWEKIIREETPYEFVPTPIEALNRKIRGFVKGGITVVKALPGTGKTTIFRFFQHDLIKNSDAKIAILHMEEMKSTTGRGLVTYELGANVSTKGDAEAAGISEDEVVDTLKELTKDDRFITFDIDPHDPINDTLSKIKICREVYGVDYIFLDHLQRLAYLSGVENATSGLTSLAVKIVDMTRKDAFSVIAISHVNNDGATKYAKAVEEEAIVVIELSRDGNSEDPSERDTTHIVVTKNRPFALLGDAGCLKYDHETTMVSEDDFATYTGAKEKVIITSLKGDKIVKSKELTDKELEDEIPF